ncbi:MAG: ATP-dependent Clp protease ATP-binding subunit [Armatimonadetes bacterium]|nr:ATP-dependent Clp protease ATP-binding subunit [Armatimonadota bacterium]
MVFTIPVFVRSSGGEIPMYVVRPLFHASPEERSQLLGRAMARLTTALRRELQSASGGPRQELLAEYGFCPAVQDQLRSVEFCYQKRTARCRLLLVVLTDLRLVMCPSMPDLWFQLPRGERLEKLLPQVLERYFADGPEPESLSLEGKAWTTTLELRVRVPSVPPEELGTGLALLGGAEVGDGRTELELVGRSLDDLHPDGLMRCVARDGMVARLGGLLAAPHRSPVLVVGARKVGKTALLHQQVRIWASSHQERRFWQISPQRLISGMSFVGQWENRLLAILQHARDKDLVLCFDDLLGLFLAGISRDASLSVGEVLKPYLQRREVRVVGEITPEALHVLRERDRGFADLFALLPLEETSERETLEVLLTELRESERTHQTRFEVEALSTLIEVQRRYVREAAFPGKAASFLRQVAARHRRGTVSRAEILEHFHATSGLRLQVLDDRVTLTREEIVKHLSGSIVGQLRAVESLAEAVILAKARLAEPSRPIASYLFVGPTGVGKTQCARALAAYLFGDESRLLRFDMNEFVSPAAPIRLVGTFRQPEGLLAGAVRRQPFCVILFDEIEKAHPDVFHLLLQVMGDGRLTDSLGRTVDFSQCLLIMTSNLGVDEAGRPLGFRSRETGEGLLFHRAAERFFTPEFFNRLDRVVPFSRLSRAEVGKIAGSLLHRLLSREGLVRRQCILDVDDEAMQRIVDRGFHPQLGARALKRTVEREIAAPVARRLAEMTPDSPMLIAVRPRHDGLAVEVAELLPAEPAYGSLDRLFEQPERLVGAIERRLDALEKEHSRLAPRGAVAGEELSSEQLLYFDTRERIRHLRGIARTIRLVRGSETNRPGRRAESHRPLLRASGTNGWPDLFAGPELRLALRDFIEGLTLRAGEARVQGKLALLLAEYALLEPSTAEESTRLTVAWPVDGQLAGRRLADGYRYLFEELELSVEAVEESERRCNYRIAGLQAGLIAASETGIHLFCTGRSGLVPVVVRAASSTPARVLRVYDERYGTLDLRTGWILRGGLPDSEELRQLVLTALPLPGVFLAGLEL